MTIDIMKCMFLWYKEKHQELYIVQPSYVWSLTQAQSPIVILLGSKAKQTTYPFVDSNLFIGLTQPLK